MSQKLGYEICGAGAVIGLLAGALEGTRMMVPPALQLMLQGTVASRIFVVIALRTVLGFVHWAGEPG